MLPCSSRPQDRDTLSKSSAVTSVGSIRSVLPAVGTGQRSCGVDGSDDDDDDRSPEKSHRQPPSVRLREGRTRPKNCLHALNCDASLPSKTARLGKRKTRSLLASSRSKGKSFTPALLIHYLSIERLLNGYLFNFGPRTSKGWEPWKWGRLKPLTVPKRL